MLQEGGDVTSFLRIIYFLETCWHDWLLASNSFRGCLLTWRNFCNEVILMMSSSRKLTTNVACISWKNYSANLLTWHSFSRSNPIDDITLSKLHAKVAWHLANGLFCKTYWLLVDVIHVKLVADVILAEACCWHHPHITGCWRHPSKRLLVTGAFLARSSSGVLRKLVKVSWNLSFSRNILFLLLIQPTNFCWLGAFMTLNNCYLLFFQMYILT